MVDLSIDLAGVELIGYGIRADDTVSLKLTGEGDLDPLSEAGTRKPVDPVLARLLEAVEQLNQLFDGDTFTDADMVGFYTHIKGKTAENQTIATQARVNSEKQFLASPDLKTTVIDAIVTSGDNFTKMTGEAVGDDHKLARIVDVIGRSLYQDGRPAA